MSRCFVMSACVLALVGCGEESSTTPASSGSEGASVSQPLVADSGHQQSVQDALDSAQGQTGGGVPETVSPTAGDAPNTTGSSGDDVIGAEVANVANVVERYVAQVLEATRVLEEIDSRVSAVSNAPAVRDAMSLLGELVSQLEEQSPETMALVRERFGEEIANAQGMLQAQVERILGDSELSGVVGEWIQSIPSLEM
ncbi:MAG: hypothetical protein ACF8GE_10260 [Phycisphaerales bacterium JB043]